VVLASRGLRELETGLEPEPDRAIRAARRWRALRIFVETTVLALALTVLAMLPH